MKKIEAVKIQAKMLEGKSKKWYSLTCAKSSDCVWLSNGIIYTAVKPLASAMGYKSVPWDTREFTLGENV